VNRWVGAMALEDNIRHAVEEDILKVCYDPGLPK
jgi:hypothetical protein